MYTVTLNKRVSLIFFSSGTRQLIFTFGEVKMRNGELKGTNYCKLLSGLDSLRG